MTETAQVTPVGSAAQNQGDRFGGGRQVPALPGIGSRVAAAREFSLQVLISPTNPCRDDNCCSRRTTPAFWIDQIYAGLQWPDRRSILSTILMGQGVPGSGITTASRPAAAAPAFRSDRQVSTAKPAVLHTEGYTP